MASSKEMEFATFGKTSGQIQNRANFRPSQYIIPLVIDALAVSNCAYVWKKTHLMKLIRNLTLHRGLKRHKVGYLIFPDFRTQP